MTNESFTFSYLSEIITLPVVNLRDNKKLGRIVDLAATTTQVYPKATGIITKISGRPGAIYIPWNAVRKVDLHEGLFIDYVPGQENGRESENEILLKRTFLDKQVISTRGYKVVRVNDLHMLVDASTKGSPSLYLAHIDVGVKGLLRRLGWLRIANGIFKWIVDRDIRDQFVSWKYVQPTSTTDVHGSLHLKTDSSKLSEIHPADLADILEDLGTEERISLIESFDNATAAATIQEMPLRTRVQIAETLEADKLAAIINEMQMDEVVDLLDELAPEQRSSVFQRLNKEKVADIMELSQLSAHRVGSIMNPGFLSVRLGTTVRDILQTVHSESLTTELLYYVYVLDSQDHLKGVVTLRHLFAADPMTPVEAVMNENLITVTIDASLKRVAQVFFKYKFEAVPVVDEEGHIQGIVTLRDTLEAVFPEVREESKG